MTARLELLASTAQPPPVPRRHRHRARRDRADAPAEPTGIARRECVRQGIASPGDSTPAIRMRRGRRISRRARRTCSLIFCCGACSQLDTFDYKPELIRRHGQPLPGSEKLITFQGEQGTLTRSPWEFRPRGQCGKMISDLVPHLGELADDICFIHSMQGKTNTHGPGENFMSTGFTLDGFPSMGAWVTYALGSEDQSLPAYVAIPDPRGVPQNSVNNWAPGLSARGVSGHRRSMRPSRFAISPGPASIHRRDRRRDARLSAAAERASPRALSRRHANSPPASPATNSPRACSSRVPEVADLSTRAGAHPASSTARTKAARR